MVMDVLTNKRYESYDYICRYAGVPYYYNAVDKRDVYGIGSNLKKSTPYVTHIVQDDDTLDSLALQYYGNPTLWWAIAYFNDIQDALIPITQLTETIRIPTITAIEFGADRA